MTNKRAIKSTILAEDGQVIVLGGLIQDDVTRTNSKVPLLGDIPLLGGLFRSTQETHIKRNLMVFLRPTVIRDRAGLAALSGKKYSDIRVIETDSASPTILPGQSHPAVRWSRRACPGHRPTSVTTMPGKVERSCGR